MALNVLRKDPIKESLRATFKIAAWNNAYLTSLLEQFRNAIALGTTIS